MQPLQTYPSESSAAGDFARHLAWLLGPAYQPSDGSRAGADLLALGGALSAAYNTNLASVAEAFADTVAQLLSEWETMLGLPVRTDLATAARQLRLLAKVRAKFSGTPQDLLTTVRTYDPTATLVENTPATVPHELDGIGRSGASRGVFLFDVKIAPAVFSVPIQLATIQAAVEQAKPAHTLGTVVTNANFLTDDSSSLTDRDSLGA